MSYYDLSADESSNSEHEDADSSEEEMYKDVFSRSSGMKRKAPTKSVGKSDNSHRNSNDEDDDSSADATWSQCILHLDVDCFYCACEQIDRPPQEQLHLRPFAIGQKHIIVTCNYVARRYGVRKLCSRQEALQKCPSLLIIEGSDLERYRQHAYRIYQCFRRGLQELTDQYQRTDKETVTFAARKGGMDEMFADVTLLVSAIEFQEQQQHDPGHSDRLQHSNHSASKTPANKKPFFVYGDGNNASQPTVLTEDQSGATVTIQHHAHLQSMHDDPGRNFDDEHFHTMFPESRKHHHKQRHMRQQRCQTRLWTAAKSVAQVLQDRIHQELGFTATVGVSVSPLLAKLASSTQKPFSLNLLYPWRAAHLTMSMPLRKLPQLGHATYHALHSCLLQEFQRQGGDVSSPPPFWTCRDLLQVPRGQIIKCLAQVRSLEKTSHEGCTRLLQQCQGVDTTSIVDDDGGLAKTLSVENSFRRGTVCSIPLVHQAMGDLFVRLPKLLKARQQQSHQPQNAFPTTIRLTARSVLINSSGQEDDESDDADSEDEMRSPQTSKWETNPRRDRRRTHVTKSKQAQIDGQRLHSLTLEEQALCLKRATFPLLQELVVSNTAVNITRLNIALTDFADCRTKRDSLLSSKLSRAATSTPKDPSTTGTVAGSCRGITAGVSRCDHRNDDDRQYVNAPAKPTVRRFLQTPLPTFPSNTSVKVPSASITGTSNRPNRNGRLHDFRCQTIDSTLVPPDVAVDANQKDSSPTKRSKIDHFFPRSNNRRSK